MSKVDIWLPQANTYVCWKGNWGTRKGKGDRQARPRKAKGKLGSKEMGGVQWSMEEKKGSQWRAIMHEQTTVVYLHEIYLKIQ